MAPDTRQSAGLDTVRQIWRRRRWVGVVTFGAFGLFCAKAAVPPPTARPAPSIITASFFISR